MLEKRNQRLVGIIQKMSFDYQQIRRKVLALSAQNQSLHVYNRKMCGIIRAVGEENERLRRSDKVSRLAELVCADENARVNFQKVFNPPEARRELGCQSKV